MFMNEIIQYLHNVNFYTDLDIKCNSNLNACNSFVGIDGIIQKLYKTTTTRSSKNNLLKKNNVRRLRIYDFKDQYEATVLKRMWDW